MRDWSWEPPKGHKRTTNATPPAQANHAARATNGNPPTRSLYIHLTRTPHTHHTASCATKAPATDKHGNHCGRDSDTHSAHTTETEAPEQPPGDRYQAQTPQCRQAGMNKQNEQKLRYPEPDTQSHTRSYVSTRTCLAVCGWHHQRDGEEGAQGGLRRRAVEEATGGDQG